MVICFEGKTDIDSTIVAVMRLRLRNLCEEVREDQCVFKTLACAGALVGRRGVSSVADEAEEVFEIRRRVEMVVEGPMQRLYVLFI